MSKRASFIAGAIVGLAVGAVAGFLAGLGATKAGQAFLDDLASDEEPANVASPKAISREGFSLKFPGNWKVDSEDEDYDPDHLFSIDSPGSSFVMFTIIDGATDPAEHVRAQVDGFVPKVMKTPQQSPVERWGRYTGHGVHLKGKITLGGAGGIRIFSHSSGTRSFLVVELYYDDDLEHVKPGLKLVESTFEVK